MTPMDISYDRYVYLQTMMTFVTELRMKLHLLEKIPVLIEQCI